MAPLLMARLADDQAIVSVECIFDDFTAGIMKIWSQLLSLLLYSHVLVVTSKM